jgi:Ca2+-binding EF-hand superfamily protein
MMQHPSQQEMPTDDDLETFRIVFELFDRDRSGYIDNHDLAAISVKLGKDPQEGKSSYHPLQQRNDLNFLSCSFCSYWEL